MVGRETSYTSGNARGDPALTAEVATLRKELAELRGLVLAKNGGAAAPATAGGSKH